MSDIKKDDHKDSTIVNVLDSPDYNSDEKDQKFSGEEPPREVSLARLSFRLPFDAFLLELS